MPYIKQERRKTMTSIDTPGELNYIVTKLCLDFMDMHSDSGPTYDLYNAVVGALECCKLELYRRAIAPYEERKIAENGDVYL